MAKILLIETSTALCSVALEIDGKVVSSRRSDTYSTGAGAGGRAHASLTAVFCKEVMTEAGVNIPDAVCISEGPGSYTGLRVGLSTAKGLCFGTGARLLSVGSLDVLAQMAIGKASVIIPMIDARRMEVYTAMYDAAGIRQSVVEAKVVEQGAYGDVAADAVFIGDGALKCRDLIGKGEFIEACPAAEAMAGLAEREYAAGHWRDVAYFEPFYLKDFVATTSKKKLF